MKCEYYNRYVKKSPYIENLTNNIARKHATPHLVDDCSGYILMLKYRKNFIDSAKRWSGYNLKNINEIYDTILEDYFQFFNDNNSKCMIVFHEQLLGNEAEFIKNAGDFFDIPCEEKIKTTNNKMGKQGGKLVLNEKYSYSKRNISLSNYNKESRFFRTLYKNSKINTGYNEKYK